MATVQVLPKPSCKVASVPIGALYLSIEYNALSHFRLRVKCGLTWGVLVVLVLLVWSDSGLADHSDKINSKPAHLLASMIWAPSKDRSVVAVRFIECAW